MDWPSILFPSEPSCSPYRAISGRDDGSSAFELFAILLAFLKDTNMGHKPTTAQMLEICFDQNSRTSSLQLINQVHRFMMCM